MKKIILFLVGIIWFNNGMIRASDMVDGSIRLTIQLPVEDSIQKISITYFKDLLDRIPYGAITSKVVESNLINGKFEFRIPQEMEILYIQFNIEGTKPGTSRASKVFRTLENGIFLIQPRSNISIYKQGEACRFEGEGSELLAAQFAIYNDKKIELAYKAIQRSFETAFNKGNDEEREKGAYQYFANAYSLYKCNRDSLVERFLLNKPSIPKRYQDLVKANLRFEFEADLLGNLRFRISRSIWSSDYAFKKGTLRYYIDHYYASVWNIVPDLALNSWSYSYANYMKALVDLDIMNWAYGIKNSVGFGELYDLIQFRFEGTIRDRVTAGAFLEFGVNNEIPSAYYIDAVSKISDSTSLALLQEFQNGRLVGDKGFNFTLRDTMDREVSFESLKGKVVVCDFWYTGCTGCANLNKMMPPVIEAFGDNDDVVFLNISIDEDMTAWLSSVRKGIYTHEGNLNLYTNGDGSNHPLIKHYGIRAYPLIIIFDKEGNIAHFDPKGPFGDVNRIAFIEKIRALQ